MKIEKSFLICIFLLGILSLGVVCAEDSSSSDNVQDGVLVKLLLKTVRVM